MTLVIGIDPGLSGAVAFLPEGRDPWVVDLPASQVSATGFVKRALDVNGLTHLLRIHTSGFDLGAAYVFLERVNAFPGQGVASMFSLGMSYWGAAGVVAGLQLPLRLVEPKDWKGHHRIAKDKDLARGLASRLFPVVDLSRKKDHGRAEALLIAAYGRYLLTEGR